MQPCKVLWHISFFTKVKNLKFGMLVHLVVSFPMSQCMLDFSKEYDDNGILSVSRSVVRLNILQPFKACLGR